MNSTIGFASIQLVANFKIKRKNDQPLLLDRFGEIKSSFEAKIQEY